MSTRTHAKPAAISDAEYNRRQVAADATRKARQAIKVAKVARRKPFEAANNASGAVAGYLAKEADRELVGKRKTRADVLRENRQGKPQCSTVGTDMRPGERCIRATRHTGRHISQRQYFR